MAKDRSAELNGLNRIKWLALVQLILLVFIFIAFVIAGLIGALAVAAMYAGVLAVAIISIWLVVGAFGLLSFKDAGLKKARTAVIIGGILLLIGLSGVIISVASPFFLNTVVGNAGQLSCNGVPTAPGTVCGVVQGTVYNTFNTIRNAIFIIGLVLLIAGGLLYAIAELWGLWRVGSIYNSDTIKIGALLTTIISIPVVGQAILYIGVNDVIKKLAK